MGTKEQMLWDFEEGKIKYRGKRNPRTGVKPIEDLQPEEDRLKHEHNLVPRLKACCPTVGDLRCD